jgi:uncharacterized membrane protein
MTMRSEWLLKRNCSLSPRQLGYAYALLCLLSLSVATPFATLGLWFVPCFACVELGGVALALLHYSRHATDAERIALTEEALVIDRVEAGRHSQLRIDPRWARVRIPDSGPILIAIEARGLRVEVGSFVSEHVRRRVAMELQGQLRRTSLRV